MQHKRLPKSIKLSDSQSKRLQEISEFDGLDFREHAARAIDEYLKKQNLNLTLPDSSEIHAEFKTVAADKDISGAFWVSGTVGKYEFSALILKLPAKYSIDKGKLFKLFIWDALVMENTNSFIGSCIVNYDRGWDIRPSKIAEPYYEKVKSLLDNSAEKFIKNWILGDM